MTVEEIRQRLAELAEYCHDVVPFIKFRQAEDKYQQWAQACREASEHLAEAQRLLKPPPARCSQCGESFDDCRCEPPF
jgi:predicted Zn-ribbon and HTH transcriptional regulator